MSDGQRLFGAHKTWRGLAGGTVACALVARMLDLSWQLGAGFGAVALLGDALSSAAKRRLGFPPGREIPILDQIPETVPALGLFAKRLSLVSSSIVAVACTFAVLDILTARMRHLDGE